MKRSILAVFIAFFLATCVGIAVGAEKAPVEITSSAFVERTVVNAQGEKELVRQPATKVLPGEEVVFINAYVNKGNEPARDVLINNAVPEHMIYLDGSARGEKTVVTFSIDGGQSFAPLPKLTVLESDGRRRPATAADITHIRWLRTAPLAPQEEARVEFRARLK